MTTKLTSNQEKILYNIYYNEKNFFGRDRLYALIQERNLDISRRQVMEWLKRQEIHQLTNQTRRANIIQPTIMSAPLKQLGIDLVDMQNLEYNGFKYILTSIDLFNKKAYAVPLQNKETKTVVKAMKKIINDIGEKISSIRSDNGSEFISKEFKALLNKHDIKQVLGLAAKPQSNGQIERFNGMIKKMIRMTLMHTGGYDWVSVLPQLIENYNNSKHETTKKAPNNIKESEHEEIKNKISNTVLKNRDTDKQKYNIGDIVRIKQDKTTKEDYNFSQDLYEVVKVNNPKNNISAVSYQIKNKDTRKLFKDKFYNNDLLLIPAVENKIKTQKKEIISSIVRPSFQKGVKGYIVRWKAPTNQLYTFEPRDNLKEDIPKLLNAFDKKHNVEWEESRFKWKK